MNRWHDDQYVPPRILVDDLPEDDVAELDDAEDYETALEAMNSTDGADDAA